MTEHAKKLLTDILNAINLIETFIADTPTFDLYVSDNKTKSAVERQLGIIGEAIAKFGVKFPEQSFQRSKEITGFRNRLVHAYDNLDESIVWAIVKKHLPVLKKEAEEKINQF